MCHFVPANDHLRGLKQFHQCVCLFQQATGVNTFTDAFVVVETTNTYFEIHCFLPRGHSPLLKWLS